MSSIEPLRIGPFEFASRLFVGTGKYATFELMRDALEASGCQVVTVAVRRERLMDKSGRNILDFIDPEPLHAAAQHGRLLQRRGRRPHRPPRPGTAGGPGQPRRRLGEAGGAGRPQDAAARPRRHAGGPEGAQGRGLHRAVLHQRRPRSWPPRLKEAGADSVMPAGSPIGSGQGVLNPWNIRIILEQLKAGDPDYPVIVDAGVGTASDVTIAMELGADGVLLNTGHRRRQGPRADGPAPCGWRIEAGYLGPPRRAHPAETLRHGLSSPADGVGRERTLMDRRTRICIWIIVLGPDELPGLHHRLHVHRRGRHERLRHRTSPPAAAGRPGRTTSSAGGRTTSRSPPACGCTPPSTPSASG